MWIKRKIQENWPPNGSLPALILIGPRQSGKSSFLRQVSEPDRKWISLDEAASRDLAQRDPGQLLRLAGSKLCIDEVQYAPALFPEIKLLIDQWRQSGRSKPAPSIWMTGSNQIDLDRTVKENLAGRANYINFPSLSANELQKHYSDVRPEVLFFKGGWPELYVDEALSPIRYLNDYVQNVLEKDIVISAGIQKLSEFHRLLRLLAARTGQILDKSMLGRDAGIKGPTVTEWISFLERMSFAYQVEPWGTNISKRIIKSPKFYFLDVALATRLQGWQEAEPLLLSPAVGHLFETVVLIEIIKTKAILQRDWVVGFCRTKEQDEVDFIIESPKKELLAIEVKWSSKEAAAYAPASSISKLLPGARHIVVSYFGGNSLKGVEHLSLFDLADLLETL